MYLNNSLARRILCAALCATALLFILLAPAAGAVNGVGARGVTLRLWGGLWGVPDKDESKYETGPWMRATRAVFDEFRKQHPEIEIVSSDGLKIQGPAAESNFLLAMAGGTAPDVFYVNFRKLHTYIGQNFLEPLDEYVKRDPEALARVHPEIRKVITVNGHVYCIPWFQAAMALFYRKDLFREVGLDPDKPPKTWDEFYEYAKRLTDQDKGRWGFFFPKPQGGYYLTSFIWQAGGDVVRKDKDGRYMAVFNSPAGVEALKFFVKMTRGKWTRGGKTYYGVAGMYDEYLPEVKRGKIAMWYAGTYDAITSRSDLNPNLIGIAPLPAGPTGIKANEINAGMWAMSAQIKDPRVRQAAWEYIKFMSGPKADEIRTRSYVENGLWKYVNPVKLKQYGYDEYLSEIPKTWYDANTDAFRHGRPEPNGPNCEMIYNEMDPPMQAIYQNPNADPKALLDACVQRINTKLLGNIPPDVTRKRRVIAWFVVLGALALIATVVTREVRSLARAHAADATSEGFTLRRRPRALPLEPAREKFSLDPRLRICPSQSGWANPAQEGQGNTCFLAESRDRVSGGIWGKAPRTPLLRHLTAWAFMLPAVLSVLTWAYYPLLRGMVMAFQDYRILGGTKFVGFDNFIAVMGQDTFWRGLLNSFQYVGLSLLMGFFAPILLALMLAEVPRGKMLFRTLYYLPAITSGLVIMFLWKWFYDPTPQGLFNSIIGILHIPAQTWLNDSRLAMVCVILPVVWAGAGPASIIYLAALKSIPDEMYEAADVDAAGIWAKIRHIALPMLKPLIIINFVGAFIGAFKAMENVFVMTGGGPNYATHVIGLDIWYNAFMYLKFGFATSEAWIMGSMLIGFTMYQLRILKDLKFSAGG